MKFSQIGTALLISGVTMLAVHQFTVKVVASKVDDAFLQYNILDALVGVFVVSLVFIAAGAVAGVASASKNYLQQKN